MTFSQRETVNKDTRTAVGQSEHARSDHGLRIVEFRISDCNPKTQNRNHREIWGLGMQSGIRNLQNTVGIVFSVLGMQSEIPNVQHSLHYRRGEVSAAERGDDIVVKPISEEEK